MRWLFLVLAITFEVAGTTSMKLSEGFTKLIPSIGIFVFYAISFTFLTLALKQMDISTAYAIWSALGTALIVVVGLMIFKETLTPLKIASLTLIVGGVVGLNLAGGAH